MYEGIAFSKLCVCKTVLSNTVSLLFHLRDDKKDYTSLKLCLPQEQFIMFVTTVDSHKKKHFVLIVLGKNLE